MKAKLTSAQLKVLFRQNPKTSKDGGFQSLIVSLQNRTTGVIDLTPQDLKKILRYAKKYGNGGWEKRLIAIFGHFL